jgi:hypothetical protein
MFWSYSLAKFMDVPKFEEHDILKAHPGQSIFLGFMY